MRKAIYLLAVWVLAGGLTLGAGTGATGAGVKPSIDLSTKMLVPGQTMVITGSGWQAGSSVVATICGAKAASGTVDCAVTSTATMVATSRGLLWSHITEAVPPEPCPCVVLVTSTTSTLTLKIPVKVTGAGTAPVRSLASSATPGLRILAYHVVGGLTWSGAFGLPAPRTLEFRLQNTGPEPIDPVLVGRWGSGKDLANVIKMPHISALGPGESRDVKVPFSLGDLSIGDYRVATRAQVVGYSAETSAFARTSLWPVGLLVGAITLLLLILLMVLDTRRRRNRWSGEAHAGGRDIAAGAIDPAAIDLFPV